MPKQALMRNSSEMRLFQRVGGRCEPADVLRELASEPEGEPAWCFGIACVAGSFPALRARVNTGKACLVLTRVVPREYNLSSLAKS